jgi:NADH-quinone oxidoreductase subunit J
MVELNVQTIAFFIFAVLGLGGAFGLVTTRNLIHGALYLIMSLFGGAGFFILLSAPFLAAVQVLVYIGAIAILFIFAVMLTRGMTRLREVFNRQWWASAIVSVVIFVLLVVGVVLPVWGANGTNPNQPPTDLVATTEDLGVALVDGSQYVLPFLVSSLLLTGAMIGAIVVARDDQE